MNKQATYTHKSSLTIHITFLMASLLGLSVMLGSAHASPQHTKKTVTFTIKNEGFPAQVVVYNPSCGPMMYLGHTGYCDQFPVEKGKPVQWTHTGYHFGLFTFAVANADLPLTFVAACTTTKLGGEVIITKAAKTSSKNMSDTTTIKPRHCYAD